MFGTLRHHGKSGQLSRVPDSHCSPSSFDDGDASVCDASYVLFSLSRDAVVSILPSLRPTSYLSSHPTRTRTPPQTSWTCDLPSYVSYQFCASLYGISSPSPRRSPTWTTPSRRPSWRCFEMRSWSDWRYASGMKKRRKKPMRKRMTRTAARASRWCGGTEERAPQSSGAAKQGRCWSADAVREPNWGFGGEHARSGVSLWHTDGRRESWRKEQTREDLREREPVTRGEPEVDNPARIGTLGFAGQERVLS